MKPVIKFICADADQQKLAWTLIAGMEATTAPEGKTEESMEWAKENYTALFAAVYFWTTVKIRAVTTDRAVSREPFLQQRREIISLLTEARKKVEVMSTDSDDPWDGWADLRPRDFTNGVNEVEQRGWLGDWWTGIEDAFNPNDSSNLQVPEDEDMDTLGPIQVQRADTMFQDKYDYLSEARQADYRDWKTDMIARISQLEDKRSAMEVDA